ncbi:YbhN family protein [Actinomadura sp. 7K507]|uniref:lysylphosphatidylglycerol synthase transmembrane domain-containing protein n=1 Tax=Actinomadura sp. 7K507 TaxID=2530365 RepID=UPI001042E708|nr:YbhN family protein [Actinomadura sp. 7K507]TDC90921.1 flippase-like domain-containing protein [Actinomadura sp. 7K507]
MNTIAAGAESAAPAKLPDLGGRAGPLPRIPRVRRARWAVAGILLACGVTAALVTAGPLRPALSAFGQMRWAFLPVLLLLCVLHFVSSAVALRAASGRPIPLYQTTLTQFTASAANRVTPGGLGAVAVNTRYLVCRGLPLPQAAVTVAAVQVAGVPADLLLLGAVIGLGGGNGQLLDALGRHAAHAAGLVPPVPLLIGAGVLLLAALLWGRRVLRSEAVGRAVAGIADLCRRPRDLGVVLAGSAATTLVLGLAFALSAFAVPGTGVGPGDVLALVAAYLVGAAAGSAVPSPGGVGSTEAALVGALVALGIAAGPALHAVLLFRAVTFWAPVPVGLLACRTLRR